MALENVQALKGLVAGGGVAGPVQLARSDMQGIAAVLCTRKNDVLKTLNGGICDLLAP